MAFSEEAEESKQSSSVPTLSRKRITPSGEDRTSPFVTKRGYYALTGRKSEDRLVSGVAIFEKEGRFVEADVAVDGHGGSEVAAFVSKELPLKLQALCLERASELDVELRNENEWSKVLNDAFQQVNDAWDRFATTPSERRAGAVATLILVGCGSVCMIAHVGDGKAVANVGDVVSELTKVHRATDPEERTRIESSGCCVFNNRVRGVLEPSRAFGDVMIRTDRSGNLNNMMIRPEPQVVSFALEEPGCMVIGTDGLFDVIPASIVAQAASKMLEKTPDVQYAARYLAEQASLRSDDDVSVIVISWK